MKRISAAVVLSVLCLAQSAEARTKRGAAWRVPQNQTATTTTGTPETLTLPSDSERPLEAELEEALAFIPSLGFGLRLDTQYTGGGAIEQGFALPSARFTAFGDLDSHVRYRLTLGQAKEFSAVTLPTIVPVEAYVDLLTADDYGSLDARMFRLRVGMFTPSLNPWWTPDLAELTLPDYHLLHRELFINRDLGAELLYTPLPDRLSLHAGYFNGTGIFGGNSNTARAVTAGFNLGFPMDGFRLSLGGSGFYSEQASQGSITFRVRRLANLYLRGQWGKSDGEFTLEAVAGAFDEANGNIEPTGYAANLRFRLIDSVDLWMRAENMSAVEVGRGTIQRYQIGPILHYGSILTTYLAYEYFSETSQSQDSAFIRLRIVI